MAYLLSQSLHNLSIHDTSIPTSLRSIPIPTTDPTLFAISIDGNIASTTSNSSTLTIDGTTHTPTIQHPITYIAYQRNSARYITLANQDTIMYFDTKEEKTRHILNAQIQTISEANDNNAIAIITKAQKVSIYNKTTNMSNTLDIPSTQTPYKMAYSFFRKTLLAVIVADSATNTANIILYDTAISYKPARKIDKPHGAAPIIDIAFSPYNKYLMATIGADRKLVLHDCERGGKIKDFQLDCIPQSLALKGDGVTTAIGTTDGNIILYDLRKMEVPVAVTEVHRSSIIRLCFQQTKPKMSQATPVSSTVAAAMPQAKPIVPAQPIVASQKPISATPVKQLRSAKSFMDAFSPLKPVVSSERALGRSASFPEKVPQPVFTDQGNLKPTQPSLLSQTRTTFSTGYDMPLIPPPSKEALAAPPSPRIVSSSFTPPASDTPTAPPVPQQQPPIIQKTEIPVTFMKQNTAPDSVKLTRIQQNLLHKTSEANIESTMDMDVIMQEENANHHNETTSEQPGKSAGLNFQVETFQNAVRDVIENSLSEMRQDIRNLHLDTINGLVVQRAETEALMKEYIYPLMNEVHSLREENRRLRSGEYIYDYDSD